MSYDVEMVNTLIEIGNEADESNVEVRDKLVSDFNLLNLFYDDLNEEHKDDIDDLEDKFDITLVN